MLKSSKTDLPTGSRRGSSGNLTRVVKLRETAAFPAFRPARAIPSERTMCKLKVWHTVDAVLAGYYEDEATGTIDSLLFGLYGDDGLLHFVGHSRVYFDAAESKLPTR